MQIHIAEFSTDSLTSNDSFVIVTPKDLLCWHGRHANVIEKAKVYQWISFISLDFTLLKRADLSTIESIVILYLFFTVNLKAIDF